MWLDFWLTHYNINVVDGWPTNQSHHCVAVVVRVSDRPSGSDFIRQSLLRDATQLSSINCNRRARAPTIPICARGHSLVEIFIRQPRSRCRRFLEFSVGFASTVLFAILFVSNGQNSQRTSLERANKIPHVHPSVAFNAGEWTNSSLKNTPHQEKNIFSNQTTNQQNQPTNCQIIINIHHQPKQPQKSIHLRHTYL